MGSTSITGADGGHTLEVQRDYVEAEHMGYSVYSPHWRYTDKAGHLHTVHDPGEGQSTIVFTAVEVEEPGSRYFCSDCREDHWDTELRCRQCYQVLKPTLKHIPGGVIRIPTQIHYIVDGTEVTKEEAQQILPGLIL